MNVSRGFDGISTSLAPYLLASVDLLVSEILPSPPSEFYGSCHFAWSTCTVKMSGLQAVECTWCASHASIKCFQSFSAMSSMLIQVFFSALIVWCNIFSIMPIGK